MPTTENIDLSGLRIRRESEPSVSSGPPKRGRFGIVAAVVVIAAVAVALWFRNDFSREEVVEVTSVAFISPSQASALLTANGYVVAQRKAAIASKATGRLVSLDFVEGDRVSKGQIIGRIESADVEAALAQAEANLEFNKSEQIDAQHSLDRTKSLFNQKLASQADVDAAQWRADRVAASIKAALAAVNAAEVQVENTRIRAPFDGTILTKNADIGEVVAPFGAGASSKVAVVTIADMNSLEVEADVSESNIERIATNQSCEIVLDAYPDQQYPGFVHKIVPTADRTKATVLTKVKFKERDSRVLPEMSAKVHFLPNDIKEQSSTKPVLAVDASAVRERDGKKVVYVFSNNSVRETPVTLGKMFGTKAEVLGGVTSGEKIVLNPSDDIHSGSRVKLRD